MDIFIPEECVMRRRSERKVVPGALKKQIWCLNQEGWRRMEKEKKARLPTFGLENEFMVSKDVSENVTLGGFSA